MRVLRVRRNTILVWAADAPTATTSGAAQGVRVRLVEHSTVDRVSDYRDPHYAGVFRGLLEDSQLGVYAWDDDRVIGHNWALTCRDRATTVNHYLKIYPGDALLHYGNVAPEFRGRGIQSLMVTALRRELVSRGATRVLTDMSRDNTASLRGLSKAGFRPIGRGTYVQALDHLVLRHQTLPRPQP